jgi:hypothetical protein
MTIIGYWIGSHGAELFPAPQECQGELSDSVREKLANYLDGGQMHEQYRGLSWCRFDCGIESSKMGSKDLTDGVWIWPEALSHYIRKHSVILPSEFISWALGESSIPRPSSKDRDLDFWLAWGQTRRNPDFRKKLRALAHQHRRAGLKELRQLKFESTRATSKDDKCLWLRCDAQASSGKALCSYHLTDPHIRQLKITVPYSPLLSFLKSCS